VAKALPTKVGKWKVIRQLESGAFGLTLLAQDSTNPDVFAALKFLVSSPLQEDFEVTRTRFERERKILASLDSPYLCRLLDDDVRGAQPWIAIDYLPGKSLKSKISEDRTLDETEWFRLAHDLLSGLSYLHKLEVIHRDLNYGNILDTSLGYRIIDFGISYKQGLPTVTVGPLTHVLFTSPEQLLPDGKITTKSDIFALATLLVYAGTNRSPWTNDPTAMTDKRSALSSFEIPTNTISAEPIYHGLSTNQKILLQQMHQKDPAKRPTADEALAKLKQLATRAYLKPVSSALTSNRPTPGLKSSPRPVKKAPVPRPPVQKKAVAAKPVVAKRKPVAKAPFVVPERVASEGTNFFKKYWKDILIFWITTPIGWLIYRAVKDRELAGKIGANPKFNNFRTWKITYLLLHGFSAGLLTPIVGIPLAVKIKRPIFNAFVGFNLISALLIFNSLGSLPEDAELPNSTGFLLLANWILGFFFKYFATPRARKQETSSEKIDAFDDEDALADLHEKYQLVEQGSSWEKLQSIVQEVLVFEGMERFNIEFSQTNIAGIYFQGYREEDGAITIEAAANLSVKPKITTEQSSRIIAAGWEPPAGSNPNFIQFLEINESSLEAVASLIINTLRDGYGASLEGLEPIFSVSNGGEVTYVNFEEFKRLTR
jgi:serine/threonine protein kinase